MLDSLPPELLEAMFTHIKDNADLVALSRVSRQFRAPLVPHIFKVLTIKSYDNFNPWMLLSIPYDDKNRIASVPNVLAVVKELHFKAPFEVPKGGGQIRCEHCFTPPWSVTSASSQGSESDSAELQVDGGTTSRKQDDRGDSAEPTDSEPQPQQDDDEFDFGMMILNVDITQLLEALSDNQLTGFSWDMGTCFPNEILGVKGYLVTHQNSLRKLCLVTERDCDAGKEAPPLTGFANLQELSWKGLSYSQHRASLKAFLESHHKNLTSLELDFIKWRETRLVPLADSDDSDEDEATLEDSILPNSEDGYKDFMPNLQTFSLSATCFKEPWDCIIEAFNLRYVRELRLLRCDQAFKLLEYMARTGLCIDATKVELVLREVHFPEWTSLTMVDFLSPFNSLEDLFIMFESDFNNKPYYKMILRHRETLRRLVYHRRNYAHEDTIPCHGGYYDVPLRPQDGEFAHILHETKLECVGVCGKPRVLQKSFQSRASALVSLKLLHLRHAGKVEPRRKFHYEPKGYTDLESEPEEGSTEGSENGTTSPFESVPSTPDPDRSFWPSKEEQIKDKNWPDEEEKELENFADWAFGPYGFPSVQVLASGDFSHGNRFAASQRLWCRNTLSHPTDKRWRTVEKGDLIERGLVDANMDLLIACPVSPVLYRYGTPHQFPGLS